MLMQLASLLLISLFSSILLASSPKKVAIVTGASKGIGQGIVEALARDGGYHVYGTTRNSNLVGSYSGYQLVQMDPGNTGSVERTIKGIAEKESRIDLLINNASYMVLGSVESIDPDKQMLDMMNVNVVGYARTTRAVLPAMRKHKSGLIINITSSQAFEPRPLMESYSSTRSAVEAMSLGQSVYLEDYGVNVVVFEPGATNTTMGKTSPLGSVKVEGDMAGDRAENLKEMMMSRMCDGTSVEEVAGKIMVIVRSGQPDFRNHVDEKVKTRAEFIYRDSSGNALREKLKNKYSDFLSEWVFSVE